MIPNAPISSPASHSVMRTSRSGHIPAMLSISVNAADGIRTPVNGSAIRFVRMKYVGNVLKYIQTRGAVAAWHETDMAMEFHNHLVGLTIAALATLSSLALPFEPSGHRPFIHGYMYAIPAIAAYDNWNPTDFREAGEMHD